MRKLWVVGLNEYRQVVLSKSFLISLLIPIILYGGMFVMMILLQDRTDLDDRRIAIVDRTGQLGPAILEAAQERNRTEPVIQDGKQRRPLFLPELVEDLSRSDEELSFALSEQVRNNKLFAFAIIGPDYVSVDGGEGDYLHYFSDAPTFLHLPDWLYSVVRDEVETLRFDASGLDRKRVARLTSHNSLERYGLVTRDESGEIDKAKKENQLVAFFVPFGIVMLMFISVQMTTPVLLNSVIEEKMQRIAEVLLSSLTPFELMFGKLMAGVGIGLTFSIVYLGSAMAALHYLGESGWLGPAVFLQFIFFLLLSLLTFGALFAGVSAACQDLKDSQNFAGVVVLFLIIPMFLAITIIEAPDSSFAQVISLIPPFSSFTMMVRIAIPPGPDPWQVILAVVLNLAFAVAAVWAASRVFRIGILSQGKTPTWGQILRWAMRG